MTTDPRFDGPGPEAQWRARLAEGQFALQRCRPCGTWQFPPETVCRTCGAVAPGFAAASGNGTVHSTTTVRGREANHNVSIIELVEGPRMMSRVEGDPEAVAIGMAVTARIIAGDDPVVVFDPTGGGA